MRWLLVLAIACSSKQSPPTTGSGGDPTGAPTTTAGCAGVRTKIEQIYRAEATASNETPERVREAVADNTHMVLAECAVAEARVVPCVKRIGTAAELEKSCLAPLDDEGSEGEALRK